jgi:hypothetical protein
MSDEQNFARHHIDQLGLSVDVYRVWPVESIIEANTGNIYQRIADTGGLVFIHYGENKTIPEFMKTLTDLITTVSVVSDEVVNLAGRDAHHLNLTQTRSAIGVHRPNENSGYVHDHLPEERNVLSVLSFTYRGIPILVGYRVPEEVFPRYRSILERIIKSVDTSNDDT